MVSAIITLYKPDDMVGENIQTILPQVDRVILCDNSPSNNKERFNFKENVYYFSNEQNLALSGAFNRALKNEMFHWQKDDYVIFFDQDSRIEKGHVKELIQEYEDLKGLGFEVGCIGPLYYDRNANLIRIPKVKKQVNEYSYIIDSNITSSLLCQYGNLKEIDFWNEEIFLDMADWDLCWRLMYANKTCFRTKRVLLSHTVGDGELKVGPLSIRKGAPIRTYYQTRNYLFLLFKNYVPLRYKLRFLFNLIIRPIEHLMFLDLKKDRFLFVLYGYRDFFQGIHTEFKRK